LHPVRIWQLRLRNLIQTFGLRCVQRDLLSVEVSGQLVGRARAYNDGTDFTALQNPGQCHLSRRRVQFRRDVAQYTHDRIRLRGIDRRRMLLLPNLCHCPARPSDGQRGCPDLPPGTGPIKPCAICGALVDMTEFHPTYLESFEAHESHLVLRTINLDYLAVLCRKCRPHKSDERRFFNSIKPSPKCSSALS